MVKQFICLTVVVFTPFHKQPITNPPEHDLLQLHTKHKATNNKMLMQNKLQLTKPR